MTEEEKMLSGRLYRPGDPALHERLARAKRLVFQYNATPPDEDARREAILRELLGGLPEGIHLESPFTATTATCCGSAGGSTRITIASFWTRAAWKSVTR